jgi:hypothetical protein
MNLKEKKKVKISNLTNFLEESNKKIKVYHQYFLDYLHKNLLAQGVPKKF